MFFLLILMAHSLLGELDQHTSFRVDHTLRIGVAEQHVVVGFA
jgi:hypothetical protein